MLPTIPSSDFPYGVYRMLIEYSRCAHLVSMILSSSKPVGHREIAAKRPPLFSPANGAVSADFSADDASHCQVFDTSANLSQAPRCVPTTGQAKYPPYLATQHSVLFRITLAIIPSGNYLDNCFCSAHFELLMFLVRRRTHQLAILPIYLPTSCALLRVFPGEPCQTSVLLWVRKEDT